MLWLSSALFLALLGTASVEAKSVHYDWNLAATKIAPDGFKRSASLVNGKFPGPLLKANKGDLVTVNARNRLNDPSMRKATSLHWHGIFQPRNAHNDGPSFVTQCPIASNHSYPYTLALGKQAGTFWYHSHYSTQYVDGIRGPLVIYDPNDPHKELYDVDDESTIITLADWYHGAAPGLEDNWLNNNGDEPVADSGLINGVGRYSGGPAVRRARINVKHGKRYRFRIISMSAAGAFEFSIGNHSMTVIEADGVSSEPYNVESLPVLAGQRYSVVVTANQTIDNYWISGRQTVRGSTSSPSNPNFNGSDTFAVLHYDKAPNAEPTASPPTTPQDPEKQFKEYKLKPLDNPGAPGGPNTTVQTIELQFNTTGRAWFINGVQYQSPSVPTLLNILANNFTMQSQFGRNESTVVLDVSDVIEVIFRGGPGHPFHLHGHTFDVIQSASGGGPNFVNPPRRDVAASGNSPDNSQPLRIRFKRDNPGPWFLHCHIDWHKDVGLAAVLVEDPKAIQRGPQSVRPDAAWDKLCKIYQTLTPDQL